MLSWIAKAGHAGLHVATTQQGEYKVTLTTIDPDERMSTASKRYYATFENGVSQPVVLGDWELSPSKSWLIAHDEALAAAKLACEVHARSAVIASPSSA